MNNGLSIGKLLIYVTFISICAFIMYNYFKNTAAASVPQDMQINYKPADFTFEMNEEDALAILSNPQRYRKEFNELVYNFNLSILHHVADRMDLSDSIKHHLEPAYQEHHNYLRQLYYNDFISLRDSTANLYEAWYGNESASAANVLNEVASKYTCFLVNHVIMTMVKSQDGKLNVRGRKVDTPCAIAMTEALRPMITRLKERAAIDDFTRSKGMMEERVEKMIAELATVEIRDKKGLTKQMQTKIMGFNVSSTDMEISAISIIKAGFDLKEFFDIKLNTKSKTLTVTLAAPKVISHEVYPKVDKLDIGWMREVNNDDFNKNFNLLRREFRKDAVDSGIMEKSKKQAREIMNMMMSPVMTNLGGNYKLNVKFKKGPEIKVDDFETEFAKPTKEEIPFDN